MRVFEAKVYDLTSDGWGVVKDESGKVAFVPGTWPGDYIECQILREGKYRLGKVLRFIEKSGAHREAPCPHMGFESGKCGGCPWMIVNYEVQLNAKEDRLKKMLRFYSVQSEKQEAIMPSPQEFGYRSRIKVKVLNDKVGFHSILSHVFSPIQQCLVSNEEINDQIKELRKHPPPNGEIYLPKNEFKQANETINVAIKKKIASHLKSFSHAAAVELFAGSGNFTETLIKNKIKKIAAFEAEQNACRILQEKKLPGVSAECVNLFDARLLNSVAKTLPSATLLFLDPPRSGFEELHKLSLKLPKLEQIIYVSCDIMTFGRDVKTLTNKEWALKNLYAFDMFPQTPHFEVMGVLEKK